MHQIWHLAAFLFPKLKEVIKGTHFGDAKAIKMAMTMKLKVISEETFQNSINACEIKMEKCIRFEGDYFEGKNMNYLISN